MKVIEVRAEESYSVKLDISWLAELSSLVSARRRVAIVISEAMSNQIPRFSVEGVQIDFLEIADGEDGKSSQTLVRLWDELSNLGLTRDDLLVGIGGGTVTDLTGFLAATWLRGIDWVAVPTTLAGMVDAAVGGKTGINIAGGKNLVGSFHSPEAVLIDMSWLNTLSDRDFAAGLAEVVKCGFISDPSILDSLSLVTNLREIRADKKLTMELISRAVSVKAEIVSADFTEISLREVLNYGHTFGHAVEHESNYTLRHGEAVAIGMVFVAELAFARKLISTQTLHLHRSALEALGLATTLPAVFTKETLPALVRTMMGDKKARAGKIRFVLLSSDEGLVRVDDVNNEELASAYEKVIV